jgi:PAS domain S-box-containing protein
MATRRTYTRAYKLQALELLKSGKKSITEIERELGIPHGLLRTWKARLNADSDKELIRRLKRENELLHYERELLKNSAERIVLFDTEGIVTYVSPTTEPVRGIPAEDCAGKSRFLGIHRDDVELEKERWKTFVTQFGAITTNNHRIQRKDGSWLWVEYTMRNLLDDPNIHAVVVNYRDVTERRGAEEALRQKEEFFRALTENSLEGVTLLNADVNVIYRTPGAERLAAYRMEDAQTQSAFNFLHPDDLERATDMWAALINEPGKRDKGDFRFWHMDGTWHWYEIVFYNLLDNPSVHAVVTNYRDITDRKEQELALSNYMRRLEGIHAVDSDILGARSLKEIASAVLERITAYIKVEAVHILLIDLEQRVATVYASTPGPREEVVFATVRTFGSIGDVYSVLDQLQQGQVVFSNAFFGIKPQSPALQHWLSERHRITLGVPIRSHNELIGVLGLTRENPETYSPGEVDMIREITDALAIAITQRRLFDEVSAGRDHLRLLSQQLVEAQESARRQLAYDLHDQVGTNLTALSISLNMFKGELTGHAAQQIDTRLADSLKLLDETQDHIRDLIAELRPAILDDYGLEAALRWYSRQYTRRTGLTVTTHGTFLPWRLPPQAETGLFRISQEALTNIAKHAGASRVRITFERQEGIFRLLITDDGVGFDPAAQREPVERRGLGLMSMAERAESFGGHLWLESAPGNGTRVIVEIMTESSNAGEPL